MRALTPVLFGLILACPLLASPGAGFDSLRLPGVLLLSAGLLACVFVRSSRGGDRPPSPAPLRTAGFLLLGVQLLSLIGARSIVDAVPPFFILSAGLAVVSGVKAGLLRKERALALLPVISAVALGVAGIGIVQGILKQEAVSTEGNRNYAGALAAMLLPPAVAFVRRGRPWEKLLSSVAAAGTIGLLLLSESRGGFLGALAGLLAAGWALRAARVPRGLATVGAAMLVLVGAFAAGQGAQQVSQRRLETGLFRLEVWKSGLRMLAKRPILGWGAGGFSAEYPPFRSEAEFQISHNDGKEGYKEVEDPHSTWVAAAVETGVLGLLGLLLVVYVAARLWRYHVRQAADPETAAALAGLGGGALAYLVAGGFNTLSAHASHGVLFWSFLGLLEAIGESRPWRVASRGREARVAIPAAASFALVFGAAWTFRTGSAERSTIEGLSTSEAGVREQRLREALEEDPSHWHARFELGLLLSATGRYGAAAEEARETLKRRPYHVEALNLAATSLLRAGGESAEAERDLRTALSVAPFYYKSYFNLALLEARRGRTAEEEGLLTTAIDRKPDHGPSYYYRGLLRLGRGEATTAMEDFRMAIGLRYDVAGALRADWPAAAADARFSELFK